MHRLFSILIFCTALVCKAQIVDNCIDENRVNPYYQCNNSEFYPVCGCNNVTYRNNCEMTNVAGLNTNQSTYTGVCQNDLFFAFISPNPVRNNLTLALQLTSQLTGNGTLQIVNNFGNVVFTELLNSLSSIPFQRTYDVSYLEPGLYLMVIQVQGVYAVKKFIKHNY
jgi:hypothetical protein